MIKHDPRGVRLAKHHKHSKRRIDLAIAAVMAFQRASHHATRRAPQIIPL